LIDKKDLYKKSGVDVEAGGKAAELISKQARKTFRPEVVEGIGGFAGLFLPNWQKYKEPVLVSATDGVGTKLKIAQIMNRHSTVGIDLVAMCVNDIVTVGAEPLFFLDYIAIGKVIPEKILQITGGITEGCSLSGCTLLGGETAEHPGVMPEDDYDLAGFAVGIVDREKTIGKHRVKEGDSVIGLASSGLHSNGYSLVRKFVVEEEKAPLNKYIADIDCTLGEEFLRPTRIYVKTILELIKSFDIHAAAHITGGGMTKNLPRVIPEGLGVQIDKGSWKLPYIFEFIRDISGSGEESMFETFNMGIGMTLIVSQADERKVIKAAEDLGESAFKLGTIQNQKAPIVYA
jgi:phosphoribosylformylglycinamidine cyclo-ligase